MGARANPCFPLPHMADESFEEEYESEPHRSDKVFDARVLDEPIQALRTRKPLLFSPLHTVSEAMETMKAERRGAVLVTADGTAASPVMGIFTDRDVLLRVVGEGRNPASLPLSEVYTPDPEVLSADATIAWALNRMAVAGFRHVPIVDAERRPLFIVSVRDVVEFLVGFFPREVLNLPPEVGEHGFRQREGA